MVLTLRQTPSTRPKASGVHGGRLSFYWGIFERGTPVSTEETPGCTIPRTPCAGLHNYFFLLFRSGVGSLSRELQLLVYLDQELPRLLRVSPHVSLVVLLCG